MIKLVLSFVFIALCASAPRAEGCQADALMDRGCRALPPTSADAFRFCSRSRLEIVQLAFGKSCQKELEWAVKLPDVQPILTPLMKERIHVMLGELREAELRSALIRVRSTYRDGRSGRAIPVEGSGALIGVCSSRFCSQYEIKDLPRLRYFVVTAAHVASGQDVELWSGITRQRVVRSWIDGDLDLAVFEIESVGTLPLAVYVKRSTEKFLEGLFSGLSANGSIHSLISGEKLSCATVESTALAVTSGVRPSFVLLGDWLNSAPPIGDFDRDGRLVPLIRRGFSLDDFDVAVGSVQGMSGAPVFVYNPSSSRTDGGMAVLSGIVTRSSFGSAPLGPATQIIGSAAILSALDEVGAGRSSASSARWEIYGGRFLKVSADTATLFLDPGTIVGNGLIAEGYRFEEGKKAKGRKAKTVDPLKDLRSRPDLPGRIYLHDGRSTVELK